MGTYILIGAIAGLIVGAIGVYFFLESSGRSALARARAEALQLRENAVKEAQNKAKEGTAQC